MLLAILVKHFLAYIVTYTAAASLLAAVWYYIHVYKPFAAFPSLRMEPRILYWILLRRSINVVCLRMLTEMSKKYATEGMFVAWIFKPIVCVFDEDLVKSIVQDSSVTGRPHHYKLMEFSMGEGLLTSNGEEWKRRTKNLLPAFHVKALKTHVSLMNNNAKLLVKTLFETKEEPIDDIFSVIALCTLRVLYESSLGVKEVDAKKEIKTIKRIQKVYAFVIQRILTPWLHFDFALQIFPYAKSVLRTDAKLKRHYRQMLENIKETVCNRDKSPVKMEEDDGLDKKPKSFGEILVEGHLKDPDVSMEQLAEEISFLIAAGFDTSAQSIMWCLFYLGHNQDIQQRLYEEISTVTYEKVEYKDVQDLIYLDCVIKETLRFHTTAPLFARRLTEDLRCEKHFIPKNTDVAVLSFALHRNPTIYPDPDKFNPDRFLDPDSKIRPWNFIPFAEGNRPCIGKKFAMLSMKIIIIHVLRNFQVFSVDRPEDLEFKWVLVMTSEKKPRMKFVPRLQC